jgi:peptide/nickel transport system substrate-binding protein
MKWKKSLAFLLAGALLMGVVSGCGQSQEVSSEESSVSVGEESSTASQEDKASVVIAMGPTSEPEAGFDPAYGWGAGEHVHEPLIQSTLTVTNTDLTIGYDLATEYSVSEDGLTWTVTIRDDAFFTDGEPLTASDVAFTYNTVKTSSSVNDFTMLDYAEAVDDTTVVFHMTRAFSIWPYTMAIVGIVPEHAYDSATYGSNPIGSGRYILKQWDRGQQVILEANPDYYGEAPKMERVTILFMEEDAAFLAAQAGQVDVAYTSATYSNESVSGYTLEAYDSVDNRGINLPTVAAGETNENGVAIGNDFTSDVLVRRAINMGVDRQEMIDNVLNGYGSPAYSVCDQMPWYSPESEVEYDPEGAAALLDEAGWIMGEDGVREKEGVKAELTLLYSNGDSVRQALTADLVNQLGELGISCTMEGVGWDTAYDRALSTPLMWGWGAHTPMELYNIYHTMEGTGLAQYSPYANETVDQLMDEALACGDLEESYQLWQQAQWNGSTGVTQEGDIPWVWLVNIDHLYWVREGLQVAQQKIHPHGHGWSLVNNVDQWSWS